MTLFHFHQKIAQIKFNERREAGRIFAADVAVELLALVPATLEKDSCGLHAAHMKLVQASSLVKIKLPIN